MPYPINAYTLPSLYWQFGLLATTVIIQIQMGSVQSEQRLGFIFDDYQLIGEEGPLKLLSDNSTEQTFALREECFVNRRQYDHAFKRLTSRNQNHDCENMLRLTKLWSKEHSGICSNMFKIYTVYEYPRVKLIDEIQARRREKKYFEEVELFSILQSCLNAMAYQPRYVNISPHMIFIIPEGVLKLVHVDLIDPNVRGVYNGKYYYSPEKMEQFQNENLQSSVSLEQESVFCLGMTILHSALLESPSNCYELSNKKVSKRKLEVLLSQVANLYSTQLYEFLAVMLEMSPTKRITFDSLQQEINNYFGNQSVLLRSSINQSHSNLHPPQLPKLEMSPKKISSENGSKQPNSSLAYSHDTFFRAPSLSLKNQTNFKNIKKSELQAMMELSSSQHSNLPRNNLLQKTKKSKVKNTDQKQNDYIQKSLIDTQKNNHSYGNVPKNIVCSKDLLSEYELNSQTKDRCVFVMQSYEDGSRYQGMMQNGQKNGYGKLLYQDGVYYQGNFKNDSIHGKGTLYYGLNRPAYSGEWLQNKFNGKGSLYNQFPLPFMGSFDYTNFNKIDECWVKFQGSFVNDIKQGGGKIFLTNGQAMQGTFAKGLLNGQGLFIPREGSPIRGLWTNNLLTLTL